MNTTPKTELLNPFSVSLKKHPFMQMVSPPVYIKGDYKIYFLYNNHFVHTFKNIVIAERGAKNTQLIDNLFNDIKPTDEASLYHDYERPKQAIFEGLDAAKLLNFKIK